MITKQGIKWIDKFGNNKDIDNELEKILPEAPEDGSGYVRQDKSWVLFPEMFDVVVRTQTEFDSLTLSPDWFGAVSVAFVGQFIHSGGVLIPPNVRQIHGFNNASITVTGFSATTVNDVPTNGGLYYGTMPTDDDYSIFNVTVKCNTSSNERCCAFNNCRNLINCYGEAGQKLGERGLWCAAFNNCYKVINCKGVGYAFAITFNMQAFGFRACHKLINCEGIAESGRLAYGMSACHNVSNSEGIATTRGDMSGSNAYGIYNCYRVSNCVGKATADGSANAYGYRGCRGIAAAAAQGVANGAGEGWAYYNCFCTSSCMTDGTSTTGIWGGTKEYAATDSDQTNYFS